MSSSKKWSIIIFSLGFVLGLFFYKALGLFYSDSSASRSSSRLKIISGLADEGDTSIQIPMTPYPGKVWRKPGVTLSTRTVASTPFAKFEIHKVKAENGKIIDDWLWADEREHVNILVHLKKEDKFMIFKQMKYGFIKPKLAVVGGLFEEGDTPEKCAIRELLEETGLEAEEMVPLGAYRVQVNSSKQLKLFEPDYEEQKHILFSHDELLDELMKGNFGEAQWAMTVSMGLLHDKKKIR